MLKQVILSALYTATAFLQGATPAAAQPATVRLTIDSPHGRITGRSVYGADGRLSSSSGLPDQVMAGRRMMLEVTPLVEGYACEEVTATITAPDGTQTTAHYEVSPLNRITIPETDVVGDIHLYAPFHAKETEAARLVFNDEFDDPDDSLPDEKSWRTSDRYSSAWNRYISPDPRVAFVSDGHLVCRAIANPGDTDDAAEMLTGAKESRGRFAFNHGYIEARIKTCPHSGNFPAFWLMPLDQSDGWPSCGEIDIWETINAQNTAYHTVHSHWTYDLGQTGAPRNSASESYTQDGEWHTYGLLKEADCLTWFVDGKRVFAYAKSTSDADALSQGQWPFDKAFYIILNQSVGNGSWAARPDLSFTYETRFDWVRVYQSAAEAEADGHEVVETALPRCPVTANADTVTDLSGRSVGEPVAPGIYIRHGRKFIPDPSRPR